MDLFFRIHEVNIRIERILLMLCTAEHSSGVQEFDYRMERINFLLGNRSIFLMKFIFCQWYQSPVFFFLRKIIPSFSRVLVVTVLIVIGPQCIYTSVIVDNAMEANPVAGFMTLMRNFVQGSPVNQDSLVRTNAIATLSYLLQKVVQLMATFLLRLYYFSSLNMSCLMQSRSHTERSQKQNRSPSVGFLSIHCAVHLGFLWEIIFQIHRVTCMVIKLYCVSLLL